MLGKFVIWAMYTDDRRGKRGWGFMSRDGHGVVHWLRDARLFDSEADAWDYLNASGDIEWMVDDDGTELYRVEPVPHWCEPPYSLFEWYPPVEG